MREYAKVAPQFWTGRTGKALKAAGPEALIVGMYLMTSPHANMIGLYHCPVAYISIDTGLSIEGASKGLRSAIEANFCTYEEDSEFVFVHEFAAYQIGEELDPKDKRVQGVVNELLKVPKTQCWQAFRARYAVPFGLPVPGIGQKPPPSPFEAPPKPGAGAGAGTGTGEKRVSGTATSAAPPTPSPPFDGMNAEILNGKAIVPIAAAWELPAEWGVDAEALGFKPGEVLREAEKFRQYWTAGKGLGTRRAVKGWRQTWSNWLEKAAKDARR